MSYEAKNVGRCQNCNFAALVERSSFITLKEFEKLRNDPDHAPIARAMDVCITCLVTPTGYASPNLEHKRLPAEEYLKT
jgi:hypothetical protein